MNRINSQVLNFVDPADPVNKGLDVFVIDKMALGFYNQPNSVSLV